MPHIRTLALFLTVSRTGSFAAAGQQVGLTPAAVGLQMRALEEELGRTLFDRGPRSMALNHHGQAFVTAAQDLVARWESALASGDNPHDLRGTERTQIGARLDESTQVAVGEDADRTARIVHDG